MSEILEDFAKELAEHVSLDKDLLKSLYELTETNFKEETNESWQKLKQQAQNFKQINEALEIQLKVKIQLYEQAKKNISDSNNSNRANIRAQLVQMSQLRYSAAFLFDKQINKFYNELPKRALYVYENSKGELETYEGDLTMLIKNASYDGRIYSIGSIKKEADNIIEKLNEEDTEYQKHVAQAQAAYRGAQARLNVFYSLAKLSSNQSGILMWKNGRRWILQKATNSGDLKEAYAAALMIQHLSNLDELCKVDQGSPPYYSHELISTFSGYLSNVTNKAAVLEEDVVTDLAQYSVKSEKSALPGIAQYLTAANVILSSQSPLEKIDFKTQVSNLLPEEIHRNKTFKTVKGLSVQSLEETGLRKIIAATKRKI